MLVFYEDNPYFIYGTWQLVGFASTMYIIVNIKELCATFPSAQNFTIGMVNGTFDASAGIFLIFKIIYDSALKVTFKEMCLYYAIGTVLIWIKTLFFSPYKILRDKEDESYSVFDNSIVGSVMCRKRTVYNF